jgi:HK97 gp10 family phage protein
MSDQGYYGGIDTDALVNGIEELALKGLKQTIYFVEERARHYVPVRKIFDQSYSPRRSTVPGLDLPSGLNREQIMQAYRKNRINTAERFNAVRRALPRNREIQTLTARVRGHANSEVSVFRGYPGRGDVFAGNFRGVEKFKNDQGETEGRLVAVRPLTNIRAGKIVMAEPTTAEAEGLLTSRGRYEVKHLRGLNGDQIGGALKRSIKVIGPNRVSGGWKGWVQAGDNKEVDYARYQEFGTRHNRAQPFLRPALYEGRRQLVGNVAKAIDPRYIKGVKIAS